MQARRALPQNRKPIRSVGGERGRPALPKDRDKSATRDLLLRDPQERLRLFVNTVQDYAMFMLDVNGVVTTWNRGAERIKGFRASEIIGKHVSVLYTRQDREAGLPGHQLALANIRGRFQCEGWRVRKDGTRFWASITITALRDDSGALIGFGKVTRDITELRAAHAELEKEVKERRRAEKNLERSERSLRELSLHLLTSQDQERRRVGRELHDSIGQYLAALKMNLEMLKHHCGDVVPFFESVRLVDASIKEVRTLSYLLFPPLLEESGLRAAIQWYVDGFSTRSGIRTSLESQNGFGRLSPEVELALFRVVQESLTNVHRHSGSESANIRLNVTGDSVELQVEDRGKGLALPSHKRGGNDWAALGVGLRGMKERLEQLGGKLELSSTNRGTSVRAVVPNPRGHTKKSRGIELVKNLKGA